MKPEVPVTFSNLLFCGDMILNHTHHKAKRQERVAATDQGPGMLFVRVLSLSAMATVNKVRKLCFLLRNEKKTKNKKN